MEDYRKRQADKYAVYKLAEEMKKLEFNRVRREKYFFPVKHALDVIKNLSVDNLTELEDELHKIKIINKDNEYLTEIQALFMDTVLDIIQKFSVFFASFEQQQIIKRIHFRINEILQFLELDPIDCQIEMETSNDAEYAEFISQTQ